MRDTTVLVPGRMDGDIAFEVFGERQRIVYSDRYRVSGVGDGDACWFDESYDRAPIRFGGSTGWYNLDEQGVRSDTVLRIYAHPLRVRVTPRTDRWTLAPRVLPSGCWTVRYESGGSLMIRATGTAVVEVQNRPLAPNEPGDPIGAATLTPIVVGLSVRVFPISSVAFADWPTAPVRSIERVRFSR